MKTSSKIFFAVLVFISGASAENKKAEAHQAEISISTAWFDFIQKRNQAFELTLEYRASERIWKFRPFIAIMTTEKGSEGSFAGVLTDIQLFSNLYLTPSFAPGIYYSGWGKEMYYGFEFRSHIELTYRFNSFRLGFNFNHISNGTFSTTIRA